jgi:potassium voltage-gated channel Eag-related subfamily H protein 8
MWFQKTGKQVLCPHFGKKPVVVPILKTAKDPKNTTSYRPISLTSTTGKSMERIINSRLNWFLETNNITANKRAGFRIHRSTSQHIAKFSHFIKGALDNKYILTTVFVDFKSAYDSVWKENLLLKLVRSGIKSNLLQWLESFISHRACKVLYGEYYTKYHILQTGVPQGAITSCTLFNLYINDLIGELNSIPGIKCLLCADDLVFWNEIDKR